MMMVLATLSCFAGSEPLSTAWFFAWRVLAGFTGGVIMVLAASTILPHTSPAKRGLVGGVIFAGVGLGIAASGTLVPLLLQQGLRETWLGLGILSGLLTLISWTGWPQESGTANLHLAESPRAARHELHATRSLHLEYGLNACALVPHMVFLVDFVARGLGQGIAAGSQYWVFYGLAAIIGPLMTGHLADRAGFRPALRFSFLIEAIAVALPSLSTAPVSLIVSSVIIGGFTPGIPPLVLGRIHELLPHSAAEQRAAWGHATTSFALFQAAAAYGFAWLFEHNNNDYLLLFRLGGAAVTLSLAVDLVTALTVARKPPGTSR
jgi:MFS family permease